MFNILTDALPVSINGYKINPDFRNMIVIEHLLLYTEDIPPLVATGLALDLFYLEQPEDFGQAITDMMSFYQGGNIWDEDEQEQGKNKFKGGGKERAYDFYEDSAMIYAAFFAQYRIDLTEVEYLHWWKFKALFANIDESQMMNKVMGYRIIDTRGMPQKQKASHERLRRYYRIKSGQKQRRLTLAERDKMLKDYIAKVMEE